MAAQITGCASTTPTAAPELDAARSLEPTELKSSLTTDEGHSGGVTRFTEASLQSLVDDDFWDTGMSAERDADGGLVYVAKTEAINDPEATRQELNFYQMQRSNRRTIFYDPVTGLPLTQGGARFGVQREFVPSAVPGQRQVRPVRQVAPRAPSPRPVTRQPTRTRTTSPARDSRR